jgi:hypothetical protein
VRAKRKAKGIRSQEPRARSQELGARIPLPHSTSSSFSRSERFRTRSLSQVALVSCRL